MLQKKSFYRAIYTIYKTNYTIQTIQKLYNSVMVNEDKY